MKLLPTLFISATLAAANAAAQAPQPQPVPPGTPQTQRTPAFAEAPALERDANETRQLLQSLFRQYPPSLQRVFRLDPSLLTNPNYLATYPNLAAFLAQHPEVAHNPTFFIGGGGGDYYEELRYNTPEDRSYRMFEQTMAGVALFTLIVTTFSVICWVIKTMIDHRRWLRVSKVQSEVHSKLFDRFTSNQDLLAYIQTPAGRRFLESAPISVDPSARGLSAPFGRILFSVQAGIVLALAGVGLNVVSQWLPVQDIAQPLFVVGVLALAVGVGFIISALAAYIMSRRLGLFDTNPLPSGSDNAGISPPHA